MEKKGKREGLGISSSSIAKLDKKNDAAVHSRGGKG